MLMQIMPAKNIKRVVIFCCESFPALIKIYPISRLNKPQKTLIVGDDKPFPGGFAKGLGKKSPDTP